MRSTSAWIILGCGFITLVALVVGGAAAYTLGFSRYRALGEQGSSQRLSKPLQVSIGLPSNGEQLEANTTQLVRGLATGPDRFLSMELWVDGRLAAVQAAASGGVSPLEGEFYWEPQNLGPHSLVMRAILEDGQTITSPQISVEILAQTATLAASEPAGPEEEPVAQPAAGGGGGVSGSDGGGGGYTTPSGPSDDETTAPAQPWEATVGSWLSSFGSNTLPESPKMFVLSSGCQPRLAVHDLSNNEDGFHVFRQYALQPDWELVATIQAQSTADWLELTDLSAEEPASYYAASFNTAGAASSNLVVIPQNGNCAEPVATQAEALTVELTSILGGANQVYCYYTMDGFNWTRWPDNGFLTPLDDGTISAEIIPPLLISNPVGDPILGPVEISMECLGWAGNELQRLGEVTIGPLGGPGGVLAEAGGDLVITDGDLTVSVGLVNAGAIGPTFPRNLDNAVWGVAPPDGPLKVNFNFPYHPQMSMFLLVPTQDIEECRQYAGSAKAALEQCTVDEEFDPEANPNLFVPGEQDYAFWVENDFSECPGHPTVACMSYDEWADEARLTGSKLWFAVYDISSAGNFTYIINEEDVFAMTLPFVECEGQRDLSAQLFYEPRRQNIGGGGGVIERTAYENPLDGGLTETIVYSQPGNVWSIDCPTPPQDYVELDIDFNSIRFREVDDDDIGSDVEDLEIFGFFRVKAPSNPQGGDIMLSLARWYYDDASCPFNEDVGGSDYDADTAREKGCPQRITDGSYDLDTLYLCHGTEAGECDLAGRGGQKGFLFDNSRVTIRVKDGESIVLSFGINEIDTASDEDYVCGNSWKSPFHPLEVWAEMDSEVQIPWHTFDENGECTVWAQITARN